MNKPIFIEAQNPTPGPSLLKRKGEGRKIGSFITVFLLNLMELPQTSTRAGRLEGVSFEMINNISDLEKFTTKFEIDKSF